MIGTARCATRGLTRAEGQKFAGESFGPLRIPPRDHRWLSAILRTLGLRFIFPSLVKALVVLGRVVRLARRLPSLVARFVSWLAGQPAHRVALRSSRPRADRSPHPPAARPGASPVGGGGVAGCPAALARSWGTSTSENFRRTAGSSWATARCIGSSTGLGQKYQMPS